MKRFSVIIGAGNVVDQETIFYSHILVNFKIIGNFL